MIHVQLDKAINNIFEDVNFVACFLRSMSYLLLVGCFGLTVKILKFGTTQTIAIIVLKNRKV